MPKVTVFTMPSCQPCRMLKRWLDKEGVQYVEEDATKNVDRLAALGYRQAPVTVTENGEHFYGFNVAKLQQIVAGG